ncbi:hypothetical protein DSUL_50255 [Desulfovibrionales bacterium]
MPMYFLQNPTHPAGGIDDEFLSPVDLLYHLYHMRRDT